MLIKRVALSNYRLFESLDTGPLPPLTLLCGPNSSGKSAFLSAILVFLQTLRTEGAGWYDPILNSLMFNGDLTTCGSFKDIVRNHLVTSTFKLTYEFEIDTKLLPFFSEDSPSDVVDTMVHTYKFVNRGAKTALRHVDIHLSATGSWYRYERVGDKLYIKRIEGDYTTDVEIPKGKLRIIARTSVGRGLPASLWLFRSTREDEEISKVYKAHRATVSYLRSIASSSSYVGPVRARPQRAYIQKDVFPGEAGVDGSNWVYLAHANLTRSKATYEKIKKNLKQLGLAENAEWNRHGDALFSINIKNPVTHQWANLCDTGQGISQIAPILTQISLQIDAHWPGSIILEQPELHLHPRAQAEFGSLLGKTTKRERSNIIVETHSDHIVNRLCADIASGKVDCDSVLILYFQMNGVVSPIRIDHVGRFIKAPLEFFDTYAIESIELLKARSKK